jgi:hypothetical protein
VSNARRAVMACGLTVFFVAACSKDPVPPLVAASIAEVSGNNQTAVAGGALAQPLIVKVTSTDNQPVPNVTVAWAVISGGGTLFAPTQTNANGESQVAWTLGPAVGAQSVTATVAGLNGSPVTFAASATAAPATQIAIGSGNGQTAAAGAALPAPLVVVVRDAANSPVAGVTVNWAVTSGNGSVSGATSTTAADGQAQINWTLGSTIGSQSVAATVIGLTGSPVTFSATATAPPATQMALVSGNSQTAAVNATLSAPLVVIVRDAANAAVAGVTVRWGVASGGGSVSAATSTTAANGQAQINWTLGSTIGAQSVTAAVSGLTGSPVTFTATATAASSLVYFLSTTGNDANDGKAAPWKTFAKAWTALQPGDTLEVADGSYTTVSPPAEKSGTSTSAITLRSATPGGASLSALNLKGNAYLTFQGFKITGTGNAVSVTSNGTGKASHHLIFRQIAFTCTSVSLNDNACFSMSDGTHHSLLEDSWGWGGGRYTVMCYGGPGGSPPNLTCDNNTFRRLVLRMGPSTSTSGNPQASLSLYYASNNIVENVIAIDGSAASNSSNAAFYITGHAPPPNADNNKFYGVIALNNLGQGFYIDCPGAVCNGTEVYNSVFWKSAQAGIVAAGGTGASDSCTPATFDHNTSGANGTHGFQLFACYNVALTNNVFVSNGGYGVNKSNTGTITANHHNGYFGNTTAARNNLTAGTGDLTSDPALLYIARIEASSPYKNAGSAGDIGANVLSRYQDGALTGTALWPWPNEARIKNDMCTGVTTGLCSSSKTLTQYIWSYLGNISPF